MKTIEFEGQLNDLKRSTAHQHQVELNDVVDAEFAVLVAMRMR